MIIFIYLKKITYVYFLLKTLGCLLKIEEYFLLVVLN